MLQTFYSKHYETMKKDETERKENPIKRRIRMWWQANMSGNIRLADYSDEIEEEKRRIIADYEAENGITWPGEEL